MAPAPGRRCLKVGSLPGPVAMSEQIRLSVQPTWLDTFLFERLASDSIPVGPQRDENTTRLATNQEGLNEVSAAWTTRPDQPGVVLSASAPIRLDDQIVGHLVLERDADRLLLESNRAVLRLLAISLIVFVVVAMILLAYATWLSVRIRKLRNAAEAAVSEDGQVRQLISPPQAGDELGDLGRSMAPSAVRPGRASTLPCAPWPTSWPMNCAHRWL